MKKIIDVTPTWRAAVQICILALEQGNEQGKKAAREELLRLADAMDIIIKQRKSEQS